MSMRETKAPSGFPDWVKRSCGAFYPVSDNQCLFGQNCSRGRSKIVICLKKLPGEYVGFSMNAGAHAGDLFQPGEIDAVEESWGFQLKFNGIRPGERDKLIQQLFSISAE